MECRRSVDPHWQAGIAKTGVEVADIVVSRHDEPAPHLIVYMLTQLPRVRSWLACPNAKFGGRHVICPFVVLGVGPVVGVTEDEAPNGVTISIRAVRI